MKGLLVWAQSSCRSQMALYREFGKVLGVPLKVAVWFYRRDANYIDNRTALGFCDDEFCDMTILKVGENLDKGRAILDAHRGWTHLCCAYQRSQVFRLISIEAMSRGEHVAIGSEAPCNMFYGWRRLAKEIYFRTKLPWVLKKTVKGADFFINYSGTDVRTARMVGWPAEKIIPFGYFPPALVGTERVLRLHNKPFKILVTGEMTWHRGSDVVLETLSILKRRGIEYQAIFTQKGPLLERLKARAVSERLPIDFVGFLPMPALHKAYESCSVYVGAGRHEPWGMRLNDALNCGVPLVVSRGMGGVKIVDDYGCGLSFRNGDVVDLADQLERLASDDALYARCAANAISAADACSPERQAVVLKRQIEERFPQWLT